MFERCAFIQIAGLSLAILSISACGDEVSSDDGLHSATAPPATLDCGGFNLSSAGEEQRVCPQGCMAVPARTAGGCLPPGVPVDEQVSLGCAPSGQFNSVQIDVIVEMFSEDGARFLVHGPHWRPAAELGLVGYEVRPDTLDQIVTLADSCDAR